MAQKSKLPGSGSMPKSKGGSNRTLDDAGCGGPLSRPDNKTMSPTKHSGGKAHPSFGSVPKVKDPAPVYYSNAGRFKAPRVK